jgi:hypothetical protein
MNNCITKVIISSDYAYRTLRNSLKTKNILWFSYENKQNRDIKVMIKNLYHSYQPTNMLRSSNDQYLQAQNATLKIKWKIKAPLDMFIISFHRNTDINKSLNIKTICRAAVTGELIRSNKLIPQYKIFESFCHTRN